MGVRSGVNKSEEIRGERKGNEEAGRQGELEGRQSELEGRERQGEGKEEGKRMRMGSVSMSSVTEK